VITSSQQINASNFQAPTFRGLDIHFGPSQSQSSSTSIVNGQRTQTVSIILSYRVSAPREGMINFGPASIVIAGKTYRTSGVSIRVNKSTSTQQQQQQSLGGQMSRSSANAQQQQQPQKPATISAEDVNLRATVNKNSVYEGEEILLTYTINTNIGIRDLSIYSKTSSQGFWSEEIRGHFPQTQQGRTVSQPLSKSLIYPQRSGKLTIEPLEVEIVGQVVTRPSRSQDPFADFNKLTMKFRPFSACAKMISDSATIGENTIIQPNVFIGNHVKIGKNCVIHSNVSIYDHTEIGDDVIIHSGSVIGADAYYFQRKPEGYRKFLSSGKVVLENRVEIGANTCIDKGVSGDTIIGEGTKMDNFVQIGHDTIIGKNCLIGSHSAIAGVTKIEDDVVIWGQVVVNKDLVIGKGAVILATSAVDKTLEGGKTYFGMPAIEARKKWRELAALRNLPDLMGKLK
jgi:UDP-3-O-[3-hydroxymyristoyl] glucosamine N-acyltransferase